MFFFLDEIPVKKKLRIEESADAEKEKPVNEEEEFGNEDCWDEEVYGDALGANPNVDPRAVVPLTQAVIDRWTAWVKKGTSAERLSFLTGQYILPDFLTPPKLNV